MRHYIRKEKLEWVKDYIQKFVYMIAICQAKQEKLSSVFTQTNAAVGRKIL